MKRPLLRMFVLFMLVHQVAQGGTSTSLIRTSSSMDGFPVANVFDGNWTTRWDSERSDPQYRPYLL